MKLYGYYDETAPSGMRGFTSKRLAKSQRSKDYARAKRPELFLIDIGELTHQRAADLLTGEGFAELMEDIL